MGSLLWWYMTSFKYDAGQKFPKCCWLQMNVALITQTLIFKRFGSMACLCAHSPDPRTYRRRSTAPPPCWRTPGLAWKPSRKQTEGKRHLDKTPQAPGSSAGHDLLSVLSHQQCVSCQPQETSGTLLIWPSDSFNKTFILFFYFI